MDIKEIRKNLFFSPSLNCIIMNKSQSPKFEELQQVMENDDNDKISAMFAEPNSNFPVSISLFTSISCSMKCSYCYYSSGHNRDKDLSLDDLSNVIVFLIKNAKIRRLMGKPSEIKVTFTGGGEPTFNWKNFTFFVDNLKEKANKDNLQVSFYLVTNGVLSNNQIDYICKNIDEIQISYDGNSEIQNANRKLVDGSDSAWRVENTMRYLCQKKKYFYVRSTLLPNYYDKINEMVHDILGNYNYAVQYDIEPIQYVGRAHDSKKYGISDNEMFINEFIKTKSEVIKLYPNKSFSCSLFDLKNVRVPCSSIAGVSPVIDNRGFVFPCSCRLDENTQRMGQIQDGKIIIEQTSFYESIYNKILMTECGKCSYFSLCAGGCPFTFLRDDEGNLVGDGKEKCMLLKKYWEYAFSELGEKKSFLNLKLVEKKCFKNWIIYQIEEDKPVWE